MTEWRLAALLDWPDLIAFITVLSVITTVFYKIYTAKSGSAKSDTPNTSNGLRQMEKDVVRFQSEYRSLQKDIGRIETQLIEMRSVMDHQGKSIATIRGILQQSLKGNDSE